MMELHLRDNGHLMRNGPASATANAAGPALSDVTKHFRNVPAPRAKRRAAPKGDGGDADEAACCSICLDPLCIPGGLASSQRRPVVALPCAHEFHKQCITAAVKHKPCCPLCRFDLVRCRPAEG